MLTSIYLLRWRLITREKMENYCKGKERVKNSVNDDLESLFENIQLGKEPHEWVINYFLPMLTEEELELERIDKSYLESSNSIKYVYGHSERRTVVIEPSTENLSAIPTETSSENSSEKQSCFKNCCNCSLQ